MSGAAPVIAAAQPARPAPLRRVSLSMRIALGFLHTGALYQEPSNVWRCRAFPEERVLDQTVRAIEHMGLAERREYQGHHSIRRVCIALTEAGIELYARIGGKLANHRPPPVQAEGIIRETEVAIDEIAEQEARLARQMAMIATETRETRAAADRIAASIARLEAKAGRMEHERATLASCRQDLRAFTTQAAERIGAAIVEANQ